MGIVLIVVETDTGGKHEYRVVRKAGIGAAIRQHQQEGNELKDVRAAYVLGTWR